MEQHVTYHPITDDLLQTYQFYLDPDKGEQLATDHCAAVGISDTDTARLLGLLPFFRTPNESPFEQTHGYRLALTQGFFGPYFYINDGRLSDIRESLGDYAQTWQQVMPDWPMTASARNRLLGSHSSGVFIPAQHVAKLMTDAHGVPALTQVLGTVFDAEKLATLWHALQVAHNAGAGLLEATGVVEPDPASLAESTHYSSFAQCDPTSLQKYVTAHTTATAMAAAAAPPELPVPPHLANRTMPSAGARLPTTPSLAERLKQKRDDEDSLSS